MVGLERFYRGQCQILERVARGVALAESLEAIVLLIEQFGSNMQCSILLVDPDGAHVRNGAAPTLPPDYVKFLDGQPTGARAGSCGAAAFLKQTVIVEDIATHPNWIDYKDIALAHGLRACWSTPIISDGRVLGTFAMYYKEPRGPTQHDRELVDSATHLASIAIVHDATLNELRAREERAISVANALRKSEERLRAMIEHTPNVAIQWYDDDGRILFCNKTSLDLFGWHANAVIGKTLRELDFFTPDEEARFARFRKQAATGTAPAPIEFQFRRRDGSPGALLSTVFQIPLGANETCIVCMDVDITELRNAETERRALEVQLQQNQRLQALGTLASGIAHDFNNVLAAISSNASLALEEELPVTEVRDCVGEIQSATQRATKLVRQILQFARKQEARKESVDLRPVIEEALALVTRAIASRVRVTTRFPADQAVTMIDATQLHQVVVNLVTNAVHAKTETIDIELRPYVHTGRVPLDLPEGEYLQLSITDCGTGMDEATCARIFDPFFTTKPASEGTGLGLSIVHEIVRAHSGAITVRSKLGKGTRFDVYFPRVTGDTVVARPGKGEHILLVDDEDAMVFLGTRLLTKLGYRVTGHSNANRALDELRADPQRFDAVISDLAMPGMSGVEFLDEVRRIRPDISVILTSGYARTEDFEICRAHGFGELIPKPHTADEFAWAMSHRLQEKQRAR